MTLLSYQVFKAIVEQGSFQGAAAQLGITPSAVSHAVAAMESELGAALFIRNKSGNTLTSFGKELLPYINAVLTSEESLQQAVSELSGPQKGKVRLGAFSSTCTNWIPDILKTFAKKFPNITVDIYQGTYADIVEWLRTGIVDIGLLSESACAGLPFEPLHKDPLVCITPKDFKKKSKGAFITADDIRHQQFIMLQEAVDSDIKEFLQTNDIIYSSNYHIEDDLSALVMVEHGFGITIMPEMVLTGVPYDLTIYHFENPNYRTIGLSVLSFDALPPAAKELYKHIVNLITQEDKVL